MTGKLFINGQWRDGEGDVFSSYDPATGATVWTGNSASKNDVGNAVKAARNAFKGWALTPLEKRIEILEKYRDLVRRDADDLARMISKENGKATTGMLRHKPHGVMAVLAPFNFPVHLANGHIVPALLAGNTLVVKPSELTPGPLAFLMARLEEAGLPSGVINLVQGARETGEALTTNDDVDGVLFTGGANTGLVLHRLFAGRPEKILALELGGNNPLIWWDTNDIEAAAFAVVQSAFLTAGQRCTCARRLLVPADARGDRALKALTAITSRIVVGSAFDEPQPFMGPLINPPAATAMLKAFSQRQAAGAHSIVEMSRPYADGAFVTPGIVDMTGVEEFPDEEHFGPMLQVWRVETFDQAIDQANNTRFGLAAGLLSDSRADYDKFLALSQAGIVNWNRQTTGASGAAPFGGIGHSGNHNPSAYYATDYCAYPVASMEGDTLLAMPEEQIGII